MMGVYLALIGVTFGLFKAVPGGFVPGQDKQYLVGFAQLPDGATLDRTEEVIRRMGDIALKQPGVESAVAFPACRSTASPTARTAGIVFVDAEALRGAQDGRISARGAIAGAAEPASSPRSRKPSSPCSRRRRCRASAPSAASSCRSRTAPGSATRRSTTRPRRSSPRPQQAPELAGLFSSYQVNVPQLYADIDRTKARQLGVPVTDVFETMQIYLGSLYVNDFNKFGRTYSVRVQADAQFRARADDIGQLKVRSDTGEMVPLSALLKVKPSAGPERAMRYNGFLAADINGGAGARLSRRARRRPRSSASRPRPCRTGIAFEWTDLTYQEILAGNSALLVFPLAMLLVFLVLAAQYESLTLPLSIIMIVPMGLLAAMTGVWLTGGDNNVFTQIGLIVLVGCRRRTRS